MQQLPTDTLPVEKTIHAFIMRNRPERGRAAVSYNWELSELEDALFARSATFAWLVTHYKVPLEPLLKKLLARRMQWRFANPWQIFTRWTNRDIERMSAILQRAADFLRDSNQQLAEQWELELEQFRQKTGIAEADEDSLNRWAVIHRSRQVRSPEATPEVLWAFPRDVVADLFDENPDVPQASFRSQIQTAVLVLRRAAMTLESGALRKVRDERGRSLMKPGPRRRQSIEREAAKELLTFLKQETGRELFEHVGHLLDATFPSLKWGSRDSGKRMRDRVKQLVREP